MRCSNYTESVQQPAQFIARVTEHRELSPVDHGEDPFAEDPQLIRPPASSRLPPQVQMDSLTLARKLRHRRWVKPMLFVIHAVDKAAGLSTRAKFYRAHRIHLDQAERYNVDVVTAGTLVGDDGETPAGSVFVIDAKDRTAVDAFTRSDPYHVNKVWETVQIHGYNKKRGTPIQSRQSA